MRPDFCVNSFRRSENKAGFSNSRYNITYFFEWENQPKAQYFWESGSSLIEREYEGATNIGPCFRAMRSEKRYSMTDNVPVDYTDEGLKLIPRVFGNPSLATINTIHRVIGPTHPFGVYFVYLYTIILAGVTHRISRAPKR